MKTVAFFQFSFFLANNKPEIIENGLALIMENIDLSWNNFLFTEHKTTIYVLITRQETEP